MVTFLISSKAINFHCLPAYVNENISQCGVDEGNRRDFFYKRLMMELLVLDILVELEGLNVE